MLKGCGRARDPKSNDGMAGRFLRGSGATSNRGVLEERWLGGDGEPHGRAGLTGLEVASKLEVATMWTMSNLEVLIFLAVMIAITGTVMLTLR